MNEMTIHELLSLDEFDRATVLKQGYILTSTGEKVLWVHSTWDQGYNYTIYATVRINEPIAVAGGAVILATGDRLFREVKDSDTVQKEG